MHVDDIQKCLHLPKESPETGKYVGDGPNIKLRRRSVFQSRASRPERFNSSTNLSSTSVKDFEQRIVAHNPTPYSLVPASRPASTSIPLQAHVRSGASNPGTGSSLVHRLPHISVHGPASTPQSSLGNVGGQSGSAISMPTGQYVLLGINKGRRLQLAQIDRSQCPDDSIFFTKLKDEYKAKRGMFRRLFDVKQFHHCEFVEVRRPDLLLHFSKFDTTSSRNQAIRRSFAAAKATLTTSHNTSHFTNTTPQQNNRRNGKIPPSSQTSSSIGITDAPIVCSLQ